MWKVELLLLVLAILYQGKNYKWLIDHHTKLSCYQNWKINSSNNIYNTILGTTCTNIRGSKDLSDSRDDRSVADRDGAEDYEYDEYDGEYDDEYEYDEYSSLDTFGKNHEVLRNHI